MLALSAALTATCVFQTFFILTDPNRFRALAIECLEYTVMLLFLFLAPQMRERFA